MDANFTTERARSLASMLAACFVLCGCVSLPHRSTVAAADATRPTISIYMIRRGWHIDVALDAADMMPPLASVSGNFPAVRYLVFGFGDRHYLLAADHGFFSETAALWPGPGLILVTGLASTPAAAFGNTQVIRLESTEAQLRLLQSFIFDALADSLSSVPGVPDSPLNAAAIPIAPGPYAGSWYFAAKPRYSALHTCNTWAAEALRSSGFPVHTGGIVFAWQLWWQVRRIAAPPTAIGNAQTGS
jgi:hypothetical protein